MLTVIFLLAFALNHFYTVLLSWHYLHMKIQAAGTNCTLCFIHCWIIFHVLTQSLVFLLNKQKLCVSSHRCVDCPNKTFTKLIIHLPLALLAGSLYLLYLRVLVLDGNLSISRMMRFDCSVCVCAKHRLLHCVCTYEETQMNIWHDWRNDLSGN